MELISQEALPLLLGPLSLNVLAFQVQLKFDQWNVFFCIKRSNIFTFFDGFQLPEADVPSSWNVVTEDEF